MILGILLTKLDHCVLRGDTLPSTSGAMIFLSPDKWSTYLSLLFFLDPVLFLQFCARVCSGCAVLAVLGHYVPGIMISYIVCE